jgi:hypothetical protein
MAKTKAQAKHSTKKKSTKARKPGLAKTKAPKAPAAFYSSGASTEPRKQFHILLTQNEHNDLVKLSHKMKMSAASVFRTLLSKASAA